MIDNKRPFLSGWSVFFPNGNLPPARTVPGNVDLIYEGEETQQIYLLVDGWACTFKRLSDGTRQIVDINVPGDLLGWNNLTRGPSDFTTQTLTEVKFYSWPSRQVWGLMNLDPAAGKFLFEKLAYSHYVLAEHVVNLGRSAPTRTVNLLLELEARLRRASLASGDSYACPIPQGVLADALGITPIHLNRVLRSLRLANLLSLRDGVVTILNRPKLEAFANFNSEYFDDTSMAVQMRS